MRGGAGARTWLS
uniref:Uncharacterized protein n=1 Tax=Arundo donax TaxID=35708 RepID=A0A0A9AMV2_ARUDO